MLSVKFSFDKFDKMIWRINGMVILIACICAILVGSFVAYKLFRETTGQREVVDIVNVDQNTKTEEFLRLGYFSQLSGTSFFLSPLLSDQNFSESYYSKTSTANARNYLIFDAETKKSHWILKDNQSLVLQNITIHDVWTENSKPKKAIGLIFEVVSNDTNRDQRLSDMDLSELVYYDLTDHKKIKLVEGIERHIGSERFSADAILIFYSRSGKTYVRTLTLSSLIVSDELEIATAN